jgi:hypothetical protein
MRNWQLFPEFPELVYRSIPNLCMMLEKITARAICAAANRINCQTLDESGAELLKGSL